MLKMLLSYKTKVQIPAVIKRTCSLQEHMHNHYLPLVFMYRICFKCCLNLEKFHSSQQCYIQYKSSGVAVKQLDQHQEQNIFNSDDVLAKHKVPCGTQDCYDRSDQ